MEAEIEETLLRRGAPGMPSSIRDGLDIGAEPVRPFDESIYRTMRVASEILSRIAIEDRATLVRTIRLKYEDLATRRCWQTLEAVARGWQSGRRVTLLLHGDEPSGTYRLTGEIEDRDKGWAIHEAGLTLTGMPLAWSNGIAVGGLLKEHVDIDILGERRIEGIQIAGEMTRLRLSTSPSVAGLPHIAEPF